MSPADSTGARMGNWTAVASRAPRFFLTPRGLAPASEGAAHAPDRVLQGGLTQGEHLGVRQGTTAAAEQVLAAGLDHLPCVLEGSVEGLHLGLRVEQRDHVRLEGGSVHVGETHVGEGSTEQREDVLRQRGRGVDLDVGTSVTGRRREDRLGAVGVLGGVANGNIRGIGGRGGVDGERGAGRRAHEYLTGLGAAAAAVHPFSTPAHPNAQDTRQTSVASPSSSSPSSMTPS